MKKVIKKVKGKKVLSMLLALIMVLAIASPAFSPIIAKAASTYPVELGFNNLFIFEEWANDKNSTTVVYGGTVAGAVNADIPTGSFTLTKTNTTVPQAYTGHGMDKTNSINNTDYYSMTVEPNTTYCFSYKLDRNTGDAVVPYLFMFDSAFLCKVINEAPIAASGANSFLFTTPSDVNHLQFRFTLNAGGSAEADISNISLTRCDVAFESTNLFNFDSWASSSNCSLAGCTLAPNKESDTLDVTIPAGAGGLTYYGDLQTNAGLYNIPVKSDTTYMFKYNLVDTSSAAFSQFVPFIVRANSNGEVNFDYVEGVGAAGYGKNSCMFTTKSDTAYISLVFNIINANSSQWQFRIKDIELVEVTEIDDNKYDPHRLVKTYGQDATYGTLPTPTAPENYVFAGWNTKADGTGMRITADTPVQPLSLTVYPKFEPAVDTLVVATMPKKIIYTLGEKLDTTGLVLKATIKGKTDADGDGATDPDTVFNITSGYYCTPEVLNTVGTQTITANYGGKTATFTVTVKANDPGTVIVNGVSKDVTIANNEYTLNYSTSAFNRYEVTYKSDSYVSGVATFNDGKTEEFFLEPSDNGSFSSYVDDFLESNTYNQIVKIKFTTLDKENGKFELVSLNTANVADPGDTVYFENNRYEMGVSLKAGGVVSELYDLGNDVYARTYSNGSNDITQIDYLNKLNENYGSTYKEQSNRVNLINTLDQGRYLQQSYYGTGDKPYVESEYNNAPWPYNPVQGGNVIGETSKIIDYKVTDDYVYIKARPLDWAKWSDEYAATDSRYEAEWGDSYITDTYVEAWYYFQDDVIKVTNRKVDYSGLPEASHSQEYPALYLVEPLNHFVYNNVSAQDAWKTDTSALYNNSQFIDYTDDTRSTHWSKKHNEGVLINYEEPEYWGLTEMYKNKFSMQSFEPWVTVNENWAAFTASEDADSFGVGIYTDVTNKFYYGVQPTMYQQKAGEVEGSVGEVLDTPEYRHAQTINPSPELPTSYIAPTDTATFRSYDPTEYTYYLTTGKVADIRGEFEEIYNKDAEKEAAKPKFAVPETVYLDPTNNTNGQYYVNNIMNKNNYYQLETTTEKDYMYMGFHVEGAKHFKVNLTNVDDPGNDPFVGNYVNDGTKYDNGQFDFDTTGTVEYNILGMHLTNPLEPGEKNTVKWEITVIYENGTQEVFTTYTVMYAPGRTVGAVAESRKIEKSANEISSWITGANGVDHSTWSPLGSLHGDKKGAGYFIKDPLAYPNEPLTGGTGESETDYITPMITGADVDNNVYNENTYVMQTATNGNDSSRAKSYLGLLTVDGSRYTNTNQIPNLKIGYDVLRNEGKNDNFSIGTLGAYDSLYAYNTYYTLGTAESFTSTSLSDTPDSSWTQYPTTVTSDTAVPKRETVIPEYKVSEIDGKYIHALNFATSSQSYANFIPEYRYATAGTSVLCSVTDKEALRETVTEAYGVKNPSSEFLEKLEEAATILGDPSASQEEIDLTQKELDEALSQVVDTLYALKYDNLFSAYEMSLYPNSMAIAGDRGTATYQNGTITVVNDTITAGEAYTSYGSADHFYKVQLKPNTEYVFEYDVTTDVKSQAFMFFYNASGANSEAPTNMSVQTNGGAWQSKTESNAWFGNYGNAGTYHYVIKFTTGATTTQASFRFGNTSNDPTTSTFSNIKLIDAERYYADVEYASVEDLYTEYSSYGALPVLTRPGYTFNGWKDEKGNVVTGANVATKHESIFSQWTINNYTITYNANGGSVSSASQNYTVEDTLNIPMPTRNGYAFQGWTVTAAEGNWELNGMCSPGEVPARMYGNVTLTAQWVVDEVNVTFDNLIDFSAWNKSVNANKGTMTNITSTGFTLTCSGADGELTSSSPFFEVEPGKKYKVEIDITDISNNGGSPWDVYIFFCDTNGTWIDFNDGTNRYSKGTSNTQVNGNTYSAVFTAPNKSEVVKAQIRVDSNQNGTDNTVRFDNIRVWEDTGITVSPVNKIVSGGEEYGDLPTPTREGYKFDGWQNATGQWVNASDIVTSDTTVNLYSQWTERQYGIFFDPNGLVKEYKGISVRYTEEFTPYDDLTVAGAKFLGWSLEKYATSADYAVGEKISVSRFEGIDADNTENITLYAVWELNEDAVSDDSVVADFGLGITISPFNNDTSIFGHHAFEISNYNYDFGFSTDGGNTINKTVAGTYGNFSVNKESFAIVYTPTTAALGVEETTLYTKITYRNGSVKTLTNTVKVVPASNIYFEDTIMSVKDPASTKAAWSDAGSATNTTLGAPAADDVYGFENAYDVQGDYSNGTVRTVTVNSSNKNSQTQTFDFTGTGIDIVSRCGSTTGMMLISVKKEVDGKTKTVKASIVDTYCAEGTFNQTPVFSWSGDYGTYTVEIGAMYLTTAGGVVNAQKSIKKGNLIDTGLEMNTSTDFDADVLQTMLDDAGVEDVSAEDVELIWFDDNSIFNGGTGVAPNKKGSRADGTETVNLENYVDGFRVYNPLGKDASAYDDYAASEKNVSYANVIDNLAPVNTEGSILDELFGIAYITGLGENENTVNFAKYQQAGPKGELYLNGGRAISFKINRGEGEKVMLGLRAVNGTEATTVLINDGIGEPVSVDITSATEMYYDITECIESTAGDVVITITNNSTNLLAVNHVKFSGGSGSNGAVATPRSMARSADAAEATTNKFLPITQEDLVAIENSMSGEPILAEVRNGVVVPLVEEEEEIPGDDTTPDVPEDDTNNDNNDDTNTDSGETGDFSIFSLLELLIALIEKILHSAFGTGNLF